MGNLPVSGEKDGNRMNGEINPALIVFIKYAGKLWYII